MKTAYTSLKTTLQPEDYMPLLKMAFAEDHANEDITSLAIFSPDHNTESYIVCREQAVLAGIEIAQAAFLYFDSSLKIDILAKDGDILQKNTTVLKVSGKTISVLAAERVALNFLSLLSGWSTKASMLSQTAESFGITLLDTRKTIPGYRQLAKYAMFKGGVVNHRVHLADMGLLKDNHIAEASSITVAVKKFKEKYKEKKIEVEVETLAQLREALAAQADMILLDNMSVKQMQEGCRLVQQHNQKNKTSVTTEASGNITTEKLAQLKNSCIDYASMGQLTARVEPVDFGLDIVEL